MAKHSLPTFLQMVQEPLEVEEDPPLRAFGDLFLDDDSLFTLELKAVFPPEVNGIYNVRDFYCQEKGCNCHRVTLVFFNEEEQEVYATISYGWKSMSFYHKWGLDRADAVHLTNGFLEPDEMQSEHAPFFLKTFLPYITSDPHMLAKIKERYALFTQTMAVDPSRLWRDHAEEMSENVVLFKKNARS